MSKQSLSTIATRHQVYLERLKAQQVLDFDKVHPRIEKSIREVLSALEVDTLDQLTKGQLVKVLGDLRVAQAQVQLDQLDTLSEQLKLVAGHESKFEVSTMQGAVSAAKNGTKLTPVSAAKAYQAALDHPVVNGMLLEDFTKGWSDKQLSRVEGIVRDGWAQGKTVQDMMREVRGSKARLFKDGAINASRNEAAAMVRTSTQHVAQSARMATWAANDDLIQGYSILATLDGVTTPICRSLDGEKFELGKGPVPPLHVNCRSTTIPELGPEFDFLDEGATRSSEFGYVDGKLTYYDWLKQQPDSFVKDAIGADRAKLFLEGGMTSKEFADLNLGKNFEPLTLKEMAARNPAVFRDTGLEKYIPEGGVQLELPGVATPAPVPARVLPVNMEIIAEGGRFKLWKDGELEGIFATENEAFDYIKPKEIPVAPAGQHKVQPVKIVPMPSTNHFKTPTDVDNYWFEYENSVEINEYLEGYNRNPSEQVLEAAAKLDELTQERTSFKKVYRGMVLEGIDDTQSLFQVDGVVKFDRFSATATNQQLAEMYTDPQFIGLTDNDNHERVMLVFQTPQGVKGHLSQAQDWDGKKVEVILPRTQAYRVQSIDIVTLENGYPATQVTLVPHSFF